MATFTLTDLKNEVSKKYAPTVIENGSETYTLQNLLQLPEKTREEVMDLIDQLDVEAEDEESTESSLSRQLRIFSEAIIKVEENGKGQELIDLMGGNPALVLELAQAWMNATQVGEVEPS